MKPNNNECNKLGPLTAITNRGAIGYLLESAAPDDKIFLIHGKDQYTYAQIRSAAWKVALHLVGIGLKKGDRVVLIDDSSFFWVSAYLGTLLAGGVSVPLQTNVEIDKLDAILASCLPTAAFIGRRYLGKYQPVVSGIQTVSERRVEGAADLTEVLEKSYCQEVQFPDIDDSIDLAALMFTSGSTGEPCGVMVTHRNIISNTRSILKYMYLKPEDRVMAVLPFFYCFGTSLLHTHLKIGASVVIENSFLFPEKVLNKIEETECTGLAGVPSTFQILLRSTTFKKRSLPSVRYFQQAGGKLPVNFIQEFIETFPEKEIFVMYGQTEATARLTYLAPEFLKEKLGSIGKGIPDVVLQVLDPDGKPVKPGEVGEIVASGENITAGYWNAPQETAKVFKNGKLYTGDLARIDEEGFIYVVEREKEFIKCAGHRVSSKDIEDVIVRMNGVIKAAAVPMPDDRLGEAVCVYVSHVKGDKAKEEILKYCKLNIKWPFTPKKIICMKILPMNASGKVDKVYLKNLLMERSRKDF